MDNSVASPPSVGSLLSSRSEPLARSGHSQFTWRLCQLGKGSLSPDVFISFCQKTVLIQKLSTFYSVNNDSCRQCPCAVHTLHEPTWQSWLGWDMTGRPPAALTPGLLSDGAEAWGPRDRWWSRLKARTRGRYRVEVEIKQRK